MIRSYANVQALAAIATTNANIHGFQSNERVRLLEFRTPTDAVALTVINVFVDGTLKYELIPSVYDNVIVINEELPKGCAIDVAYVKGDVTPQTLGIVAVVDIEEVA